MSLSWLTQIRICGPIRARTHHHGSLASFVAGLSSLVAVDWDQTGRLSGTTQNVYWGERKNSSSVCLLWGGGAGVRKQRWREGRFWPQTESEGMEGESLSGCWSYCGGRTGWTGNGQLKLFNPHFHPPTPPRQDQTGNSESVWKPLNRLRG